MKHECCRGLRSRSPVSYKRIWSSEVVFRRTIIVTSLENCEVERSSKSSEIWRFQGGGGIRGRY